MISKMGLGGERLIIITVFKPISMCHQVPKSASLAMFSGPSCQDCNLASTFTMELYCHVHLCVQINGRVVISPWQVPDVVMNAPGWNKDFWQFGVGLENAFLR